MNLRQFVIVVVVLAALGHTLSGQPDPREAELERLRNAFDAEQDRNKKDDLNRQVGELWNSIQTDRAAALYECWKREGDRKEKAYLGRDLVDAAVQSEQPNLVVEVAADGEFAQKEIKIPGAANSVRLKTLRTLPYEARPFFNGDPSWVVRRMTKDRFEVWTSKQGWLFDGAGDLLAEAHPPRRDGQGREWYGAFLPDGRWVTTDLWEMDRTLAFFSRTNKWLKDISSLTLAPRTRDGQGDWPALIGWCRCDRFGKGFVFSVGANGGWGTGHVDWTGEHRLMKDEAEPWLLCYPRDLEPKGMYTVLYSPNDSGRRILRRGEPGHGMFVGFPTYQDRDDESGGLNVIVPEGARFGFWPGSDATYIVSGEWDAVDPNPESELPRQNTERTWFYDATGEFAGWIDAGRIADTATGGGMLFRDSIDRVIALDRIYKVARVNRFTWNDGTTARPFKLFPELHLGFFVKGRELVLAKWASNR